MYLILEEHEDLMYLSSDAYIRLPAVIVQLNLDKTAFKLLKHRYIHDYCQDAYIGIEYMWSFITYNPHFKRDEMLDQLIETAKKYNIVVLP